MNNKDNIYTLDGKVPLTKALPFGFQHILTMFVANITPIMIIAGICDFSPQMKATLIQNAMLIAGIGTLIQLFPIFGIGSRLPVVMGLSFTFLSVCALISVQYGYSAVLGAVLVGGIVEGILGIFAKYWIKFISPIVSACVVMAIGFSLLSVGASTFGGGTGSQDFGSVENWIIASVTLLSCILFQIFAKSCYKNLSVLVGMIVGYILAIILGKVDFSGLSDISIIAIPKIFQFSFEFHPGAILPMVIVFLVSATETIGDISALTETALNREVTPKELSGGLMCDGFISSLSSLFGCTPITSFTQNVGLIAMTKVVNRYAIGLGACILVLSGIFPVFGAAIATLPSAVIGGCMVMVLGMIFVTGIGMAGKCGFSQRNILIISLSISIGIGFTQVPELFVIFPDLVKNIFGENCVVLVFLISAFLNIVLPKNMDVEKTTE